MQRLLPNTKAKAPTEPLLQLGGRRVLSCVSCRTHVADEDSIISKAFTGRHGRAFLCSDVVNVRLGAQEDRVLLTGLHTVSDISCRSCANRLGWLYVSAAALSQRYKNGCYILEKNCVYPE